MKKEKIVYLADDDADDRTFIVDAIKSVDPLIKVIETENGSQLLSLIKTTAVEPSLIVLDMNMPVMNGLETLAEIRDIPKLSEIPAVMISTSSDLTFSKYALQSGMAGYFVKPNSFQGFLSLARQLKTRFLA